MTRALLAILHHPVQSNQSADTKECMLALQLLAATPLSLSQLQDLAPWWKTTLPGVAALDKPYQDILARWQAQHDHAMLTQSLAASQHPSAPSKKM